MNAPKSWRQGGIALPVMLILLAVLLVSSLYLLKSSNSTTMTTVNLAYDSSLNKAADLGLLTGFQWLSATATSNRQLLNADSAGNGYVANLDTTLKVSDPLFWVGKRTLTDTAGNSIEYVVHRMCLLPGAYDNPGNTCVQTPANTSTLNNSVALGDSMASDSQSLAGTPQVHYVVTARIFGARGGNVVNQAVIMIGA